MTENTRKSILAESIKDKEHEKYSFYPLSDLTTIIVTLMNAYEVERYDSHPNHGKGYPTVEANRPTSETKKVVIDTWLMNYGELQLEYNSALESMFLYGFGPSESRFKLNLPEGQDLDYIQVFADVLYEYRSQHEMKEMPYEELMDLLKKYITLSEDEILERKATIKEKQKEKNNY